jgi:parallel beta-helix repeat protein
MEIACMRNIVTVVGFVLGGVLVALPTPARAETQVCTVIDALPYDITGPGLYCLEQDLAVDGSAININADHVVLDCNGHRLSSLSPGLYNGVTGGSNRQDVVVRSCVVEDFGGGIYLAGNGDPGAHGNVVEGNTVLRSGGYGIQVWGSNNRIEHNRVSGNTGANNGEADGIVLIGAGNNGCCNQVRDNVVSDFRPPLPNSFNFDTTGISFDGLQNTEITGNTVTGLYAPTGRTVHAIESQGSSNSLIARNTVLRPPPLPAPLDGAQDFGIVIFGGGTTNVCRDNVIGHFDGANISGCVDSVNTDF